MRDDRKSLLGAVFTIIAGLALLLSLAGFNPEHSLRFSAEIPEGTAHPLGPVFENLASFTVHFFGYRGAFFLACILLFNGYVCLTPRSRFRAIGTVLLSAAALMLFLKIMHLSGGEEAFRKGGIIGKYFLRGVEERVSGIILIPVLSLLLTASLYGLCHRHVRLLLVKIPRRRKAGATRPEVFKEEKRISTGEPRKGVFQRAHRERDGAVTRGGRLPLITRVVIGGAPPQGYLAVEPVGEVNDRPIDEEDEDALEGDSVFPDAEGKSSLSEPLVTKPETFSIPEGGGDSTAEKSYLQRSVSSGGREKEKETSRKARELERTLGEFGIETKVTGIIRGPVITRYELQPAPGVKLSRIVNLSNNIALSLSARGVRIEAPIPGRSAVGIEIPNESREIVTLGDIIEEGRGGGELPLILGKDLAGKVVVADLTTMPHLLIAGATGSGKSVCVNSLIMSLLFHRTQREVRFLMIDPKMVELKVYNGIPHLLTEVVTDPRDAGKAFRWVIHEMENRYSLFDQCSVRNVTGYNRKNREKLPYIVVIVDEFANLMAISQKDVEDAVVRLAAMSRAVGIHLIMATQRPSVDVITGLIKANFPYRIAFQVAGRTDSRTILDSIGAEKLLGQGDMLFAPAGSMNLQRIQGAFISEDEVVHIVEDLKKSSTPLYIEDILTAAEDQSVSAGYNDVMFDQAVETVLRTKRASASFLQRRLKIGYNRAARLIELMEEEGIIGPPRGSKPREIYIDSRE